MARPFHLSGRHELGRPCVNPCFKLLSCHLEREGATSSDRAEVVESAKSSLPNGNFESRDDHRASKPCRVTM